MLTKSEREKLNRLLDAFVMRSNEYLVLDPLSPALDRVNAALAELRKFIDEELS